MNNGPHERGPDMADPLIDRYAVYYGGALHAFSNPDAGKARLKGVAYNEAADRRSWLAMREFFDEIFK